MPYLGYLPDAVFCDVAFVAARAGLDRRIKNGRINLLPFGPFARSSGPMCPNRLLDLRHYLHDNSERDSIMTLFRRVSDVGLGYTPQRQPQAGSASAAYVRLA
jgi:hypothetical protein